MTVIHCDLCGKSLEFGIVGNRVLVSEYRSDACDDCAKKLIAFLKPGPWKGGSK